MAPTSFKTLFCQRSNCRPDLFPKLVFRHCLYRHAVIIATLFNLRNAPSYEPDRRAIEQFAIASRLDEVRAIIDDLAYVNRTNRHWLRTGLKIRISGRRLYALAEELARLS